MSAATLSRRLTSKLSNVQDDYAADSTLSEGQKKFIEMRMIIN